MEFPQTAWVFPVFQNGNSALSIARRLGYISVVDTLKVVSEETLTTQVCLWGGVGGRSSHTNVHVCAPQTVMEKHKMNVPETMNEVLDMSDDEGQAPFWGGGGVAAPPGSVFCRGSEVQEPQTLFHSLSLVL